MNVSRKNGGVLLEGKKVLEKEEEGKRELKGWRVETLRNHHQASHW